MPIDLELALGAELPEVSASWDADAVILYHLAVGAGSRPTAPSELRYTLEAKLEPLPTFATATIAPVFFGLATVPGLPLDLTRILSAEHDLSLRAPLPTEARVTHSARVAAIYDEGWAARIEVDVDTRDEAGTLLFVNRDAFWIRDAGNFGGAPSPDRAHPRPGRPADLRVETPTLPQQALWYRLCGDRNPLHADPEFARAAGFDAPILHGLCSYGAVFKTVVDEALAGRTGEIARYGARFTGYVLPGETLQTEIWREPGRLELRTRTRERGPALEGWLVLRG